MKPLSLLVKTVLVGTLLPALLFVLANFMRPIESLAFLFPQFIVPSSWQLWMLIAFMALISTLSQWLLTKAYSSKNLSIIGVISYTNIPFAIGFGYLLGDAFPDALTFSGIALIIFGGILVSRK